MAGESARDRADRAREKAERLARYAEQWEKGAEGETHTAAALERLGAGWICWHDLKWPGRRLANIDHLAIGPGGIFVIDSKNWSGRIEVKNGYCARTAISVRRPCPVALTRRWLLASWCRITWMQ